MNGVCTVSFLCYSDLQQLSRWRGTDNSLVFLISGQLHSLFIEPPTPTSSALSHFLHHLDVLLCHLNVTSQPSVLCLDVWKQLALTPPPLTVCARVREDVTRDGIFFFCVCLSSASSPCVLLPPRSVIFYIPGFTDPSWHRALSPSSFLRRTSSRPLCSRRTERGTKVSRVGSSWAEASSCGSGQCTD